MRALPSWLPLAALAAFGLLVASLVLAAAQLQSAGFSAWIYALVNLIVFTDTIDFVIRLYMHRRHTTGPATTEVVRARLLSIDLAAAARTGARRRDSRRDYARYRA